jgi:hypothetical protein
MSHLTKFPRACHKSPALTEKQVAQLVRQRSLAQHAGAWSSERVLQDYVDKVGEMHYTDNDMLFGDDEEDDAYDPSDEDDEMMPGIPRRLQPHCYMFDEATCPAWQAHMTEQVIPALVDAPGSGMYGYVVHVSSPFLPACEVGCACQKGNQGCHFVVINNQPCTVYDIPVPAYEPLYMCAAGCVIVGPANNSLSPPMYLDKSQHLCCVVDKRWVRVAKKGLHPYKAQFERFGVGSMRCAWEAVAPSNNRTTDNFINQVVGTQMKEPFVREAVYRFVQQHPEQDGHALYAKILSNPILGKKVMVKVGDNFLCAASK